MPGRPYSTLEQEIVKSHGPDLTDQGLVDLIYKRTGILRTVKGVQKQRLKHGLKRNDHSLYSIAEACLFLETSPSGLSRALKKYQLKPVRVGKSVYLTDNLLESLKEVFRTIPEGYLSLKDFARQTGLCSGAVFKQFRKTDMQPYVLKRGCRYFIPKQLVGLYTSFMRQPTSKGNPPLRTDWKKIVAQFPLLVNH